MRKFTGYSLQVTVKKVIASSSLILLVLFSASTALASTLSLSPAAGTFNKNCSFILEVLLDTQGAPTDGTDAYINFDSSRFTMISIDTAGKIYPEYPGSGIDSQNANRILISGLAAFGSPYNGSGKLASINFTVKEAAQTGLSQVTFDFDTNNKNSTIDSNVVKSVDSTETLTSVNNGSYTVGSGSCSSVTPTPTPTPRGSIGGPTVSTPSATQIPLKQIPTKESLPDGGTPEFTAVIAIVGSILTVLGILGLALL